jgi:hypothetical protein
MNESITSELVNLANETRRQHQIDYAFFRNQHNYESILKLNDDSNLDIADKLLVAFYDATHTSLEKYQTLVESQKRFDEMTNSLEALEEEITNSEAYLEHLARLEQFQSAIKIAQTQLTKIFNEAYFAQGSKISNLLDDTKTYIITFLALAGVAALSYFVTVVIAGISGVIVGMIPFAIMIILTVFVSLTCGSDAVPNPPPSPTNYDAAEAFYAASFFIGEKTYEGVYIAAPYIGYVLAAFSLIPLVLSIKSGIQALMLKYTNPEDYFKQQIQEKIENYLNKQIPETELSPSAQ